MPSDQDRLTKSPVFWLLALLIAYTPYQKGLFFQREWFYVHIFTALLILLALLTRRRYLTAFRTKLDLISLGFVLAYAIGALTAVNASPAVTELLKAINLLGVYWLLAHGGWSRKDYRSLLILLFWSGFGVAIMGLLTALGTIELSGGYVDGRVYSTFQYPNTLAAYLGLIIYLGMYLWETAKGVAKQLYAPALFIIITCLVATGSRGGLGVFLLSLPLYAWLLPKDLRRRYLTKLSLGMALGVVCSLSLFKYLADKNIVISWIILLAGLSASTLLTLLQQYLDKLSLRRLLPVIISVIVLMALVYGIRAKGENPLVHLKTLNFKASEFQTRLNYYKDGLNMIMDRPIQGYGGGGWDMYPRYQGYPYFVSDPHNQVIKVGVESGLLGLGLYVAWWIYLVAAAWKKIREGSQQALGLFTGVALVGLHSLIDFDLSFGAVALLIWGFAGILQGMNQDTGKQPKRSWTRYTEGTVATILALAISSASISFLIAEQHKGWSSFYTQQGRVEDALGELVAASKFDPFNSDYPAAQAGFYAEEKSVLELARAEAYIKAALKLNSTDPGLRELACKIYTARGNLAEAAINAEDMLSFHAYQGNSYLTTANLYQAMAEKALQQGNKELARTYLLRGAEMPERLAQKLEGVSAWEASLWRSGVPRVPETLKKKAQELKLKANNL